MRSALLLCLAGLGLSAAETNLSNEFYTAIRNNDMAKLEALVEQGGNVNIADDKGITPLMNAAALGSPEAVQLLLDKGADVNARNTFNATALIWAAADLRKVKLLVAHKADVNAASKVGHTPLLVAALSDPSIEIVRLLISKGADIKAVDNQKKTALYSATAGNDMATIRLLVDAGLDVNAPDSTGQTPLMNAASNQNLEAVKLLLLKGARINDITRPPTARTKPGTPGLGRFTALGLACAFSPTDTDVVKTLVAAGADLNVQDGRGMTPLMLASATDHQNVDAIEAILVRKPDLAIQDLNGETAFDWAIKYGPTPVLKAIQRAGGTGAGLRNVALPPAAPVDARTAVQRSITLLEKASAGFFAGAGCVSCHHTDITDIATGIARSRGIPVDEQAAADRLRLARTFFASPAPLMLERRDGAGAPDLPLYSLVTLAAIGYQPDRMTDAMAANLAVQQLTSGRWHKVSDGVSRPPIEDGDIFRTTLAIRTIRVYGTPGRAAELEERVQRAKNWLLTADALTAEDRNMQLLGLYWAGTDPAVLKKLSLGIIQTQRADGGWAQRSEPDSDAYATGQTLYTLAETVGFSPREAAYKKGTAFLLSTQRADGSWYVRSRAPKFQPYFESGFPYGHDQWISAMATGWAASALGLSLDQKAASADADWNAAALDDLAAWVQSQKTTGFLIVQDRKVIYEHNWPLPVEAANFARNFTHGTDAHGALQEDVASAQKSFIAVLAGIAIDQGLLDISKPVAAYTGAGWSKAAPEQEKLISVRNLLEMSSGLTEKLAFEALAGAKFFYNTPAYAIMKPVLEKASGRKLEELTRIWLTEPTGMADTLWRQRPAVFSDAGNPTGLYTTPRDMAKLGQLVLDQGKAADGKRVISEVQLAALFGRSPTNPAYGRLWWLNGSAYAIRAGGVRAETQLVPAAPSELVAALGAQDRKIYIVPGQKLVVVRTGQAAPDRGFDQQLWLRLMKAVPAPVTDRR